MAYTLDYTSSVDLLAAYKQELKPTTFLQKRYFPDGEVFASDEVIVEIQKGTQKMAPFVSPEINGKVMKRQGYSAYSFEPAFVAPKRPLTIDDLKKKGFGEAYYNQLTPAERATKITIDDLVEMGGMQARRREWMCARVLQDNALTMKYYTDDNELYDTKNIAYYEGQDNPAIYTPAKTWDQEGANIIGDVYSMCLSLLHSGCPAVDIIFGEEAYDAFQFNAKILELLDNRNFFFGQADPSGFDDEFVSFIGKYNFKGHKLNAITYEGTYEDDETGNISKFIDSKNIIVTAPNCGKTVYSQITQIDYGQSQFSTYVEKEVPLYEVKDQTRSVSLRSKPLVQPKAFAPFRVAKVVGDD